MKPVVCFSFSAGRFCAHVDLKDELGHCKIVSVCVFDPSSHVDSIVSTQCKWNPLYGRLLIEAVVCVVFYSMTSSLCAWCCVPSVFWPSEETQTVCCCLHVCPLVSFCPLMLKCHSGQLITLQPITLTLMTVFYSGPSSLQWRSAREERRETTRRL